MIVRLLSQSLQFRTAAVVSAMSLVMLITPSVSIQFGGLLTLVICVVLTGQRATLFEAVIPVDARRIFLTRICVGLLLTCLPVIAWILSGHLRGVPADPATAFSDVGQKVRFVALPIAALAVILPHARRPGVLPLPGHSSLPAWWWWAALAIGGAAVMGLLPLGTSTLGLAGAAMGTLAFTWRRMPRSYQLAPAGAEAAGRPLPAVRAAAPGAPAVRWWRPLLATVVPGRILFVILVVGFGGVTDSWVFYLIILWFPDLIGLARLRRQWLETLPLPRAVLLWTTLAPSMLSLLAVTLGGGVVGPTLLPVLNALHQGRPHEYSRDHIFDERTMVPLAYWQIAPRGEAPVVRASWGETAITDTISLPGVTLYNPYSARTENSPAFIEWQFGRASSAVHGRTFTIAEYHADGFVAPRRVTRSVPVYLLAGSLALTFVILLVWVVELARWHALTTRPVLRHGVGVLTGAVVVSMAVVEMFGMFKHGTMFLVPLGAAFALNMAALVPNIATLAFVAALPVIAAYALLYWQMGRSDLNGMIWRG